MEQEILSTLGARIRGLREAAGLGLAELAARARLSRRYLTEVEAGRANPTLLKLARLALALRVELGALCDLPLAGARPLRVALVGLRGAGKSTVGRALALRLELAFTELDARVEEESGLSLEQIFSLHGEESYRRREREALERYLGRTGSGVLATGGSIVTHEDTWQRLLETCFVVWLKAAPEDHWDRVVAQGDTRPMRANPRAMEELRAMLAAREAAYGRADLVIDTSRLDPAAAVEAIVSGLEELRAETLSGPA